MLFAGATSGASALAVYVNGYQLLNCVQNFNAALPDVIAALVMPPPPSTAKTVKIRSFVGDKPPRLVPNTLTLFPTA